MGDVLGALLSTSGRASRREFWKWQAISTVVPVAIFGVEALVRYRRDGRVLPVSDREPNHLDQPSPTHDSGADKQSSFSDDLPAGDNTSGDTADPWAEIISGDDAAPSSNAPEHTSKSIGWDDVVSEDGTTPSHGSDTGRIDADTDNSVENVPTDWQMMCAFPATTAATVLVAVPAGVVAIRRLHDMDKSGWHLLWSLIPVVGWPAFAMLSSQPGTDGPNRFGLPVTD